MGNNASFDKFKGNRMEFLQLSCCNIYLLEIHVSARSQKWEILESNRRKGHVVSGSVGARNESTSAFRRSTTIE